MDIDKRRTAVLGLHWQWDLLSGKGAFGTMFSAEADKAGIVPTTAGLLAAARANGVPVIYTRVAFPADYPHFVANNFLFASARDAHGLVEGAPGSQIIDELAPAPEDSVVTNDRVSGFVNSSLDFILRTRGLDTLVLTGLATNATVESTARQATDLGYRAIVLSDCTSAGSEAAHEAALASLQMLAEVGTSDAAIKAFGA